MRKSHRFDYFPKSSEMILLDILFLGDVDENRQVAYHQLHNLLIFVWRKQIRYPGSLLSYLERDWHEFQNMPNLKDWDALSPY